MTRKKAEWFGPRLKALREAAGLTQAELGRRAGVVGSQINKLELSVNQPTLAITISLAKAHGLDMAKFLEGMPDAEAGDDSPAPPRTKGRPKKPADEVQTPAPPVEAPPAKKPTKKRKGKQ